MTEQPHHEPAADARWLRLILPLAAFFLTLGWGFFWFVCDDAYIAFRAIANHQEGWGYTWNPPPFHPVEGYTSFLWVVLLDAIWSLTGVLPPVAAPVLGLIAALGTMLTTAWMAWKVPLPAQLERWRPGGTALVLAGLVTNKTFLVWTSSGMEIPLYVALHVAWYGWAVLADRSKGWLLAGAWLGLALAWTRPDGLLPLAASAAVVAGAWWSGRPFAKRDLGALLPALMFFAHLVWRKQTYGDWLPNTYYAKVAEPWLSGGGTHFWLYVLENGWFWWVPLVLAGLWRGRHAIGDLQTWRSRTGLATALGVTAFYLWYYIYKVGGDHFEFRIYAHMPALIFVGTMWLLGALGMSARRATLVFSLLLVSTWVIPWSDEWLMKDKLKMSEIKKLHTTLADVLPAPLWPWAALHDDLEGYCTRHLLAIPHQTHKQFRINTQARLIPREAAAKRLPKTVWDADAKGKQAYPVIDLTAVGVAAWRLPYVAIIDRFGLNDRVIARNTPVSPRFRYSAHDRFPPPDYAECFLPNIKALDKFEIKKRPMPLTLDRITECETWYFDHLPEIIAMSHAGRAAKMAFGDLGAELGDVPAPEVPVDPAAEAAAEPAAEPPAEPPAAPAAEPPAAPSAAPQPEEPAL